MKGGPRGTCTVPGCGRPHQGRGYCSLHYQRLRRNGDPLVEMIVRDDDQRRFWAHVAKTDGGCWTWTGPQRGQGYGRARWNKESVAAHRLAHELLIGPIPEGMEVDHLCRNRLCVNPAHLEAVDHATNTRRAAEHRPRVTHCKRGHSLDDEANVRLDARGSRHCKECERVLRRGLAA